MDLIYRVICFTVIAVVYLVVLLLAKPENKGSGRTFLSEGICASVLSWFTVRSYANGTTEMLYGIPIMVLAFALCVRSASKGSK